MSRPQRQALTFPRSSRARDSRLTLAALTLYLAVAAGGSTLLPARGLWINDQGIKYLQIRNILDSPDHSSAVRLAYSPQETGGLLPYTEEYLCRAGGRTYFILPDEFARLGAAAVRIGGCAMMRLLPLLSGILAVFFWTFAAWRYRRSSAPMLPLLVLASPWMFYHWVLWEHTTALLAQGLSLWLLLRGWKRSSTIPLILSGLALGAGAFLRPELLLFAAAVALGFSLAFRQIRRSALFVIGAAPCAALLLLENLHRWGHLLGVHYLVNTASAGPSRLASMPILLAGFPDHPLTALLSLAGLAGLLLLSTRRRLWLGWLCGLAGAMVARVVYLRLPDPFLALTGFGGLAALSPILLSGLALGFVRRTGRTGRALAFSSALFFLLGIAACPPAAATGIHWGPRMLLPGLVPAAILAADRLARSVRALRLGRLLRGWALALPALLLLGWADTGWSLSLLYRQKAHNAAVERFVEARPERFIATNLWWASQTYAPALDRHACLFLSRAEDWARFRAFVQEEGASDYLVISDRPIPAQPGLTPLEVPGAPYRHTVADAFLYRALLAPRREGQ